MFLRRADEPLLDLDPAPRLKVALRTVGEVLEVVAQGLPCGDQ